MLSHAQTDRSWVTSYHRHDIGVYQSTVGYICYCGKEPWDNRTRGQVESMRRLTPMILSLPVKDRTIVGTSDKIERMPLTQLAG